MLELNKIRVTWQLAVVVCAVGLIAIGRAMVPAEE